MTIEDLTHVCDAIIMTSLVHATCSHHIVMVAWVKDFLPLKSYRTVTHSHTSSVPSVMSTTNAAPSPDGMTRPGVCQTTSIHHDIN